jgi:hypothetical protein
MVKDTDSQILSRDMKEEAKAVGKDVSVFAFEEARKLSSDSTSPATMVTSATVSHTGGIAPTVTSDASREVALIEFKGKTNIGAVRTIDLKKGSGEIKFAFSPDNITLFENAKREGDLGGFGYPPLWVMKWAADTYKKLMETSKKPRAEVDISENFTNMQIEALSMYCKFQNTNYKTPSSYKEPWFMERRYKNFEKAWTKETGEISAEKQELLSNRVKLG